MHHVLTAYVVGRRRHRACRRGSMRSRTFTRAFWRFCTPTKRSKSPSRRSVAFARPRPAADPELTCRLALRACAVRSTSRSRRSSGTTPTSSSSFRSFCRRPSRTRTPTCRPWVRPRLTPFPRTRLVNGSDVVVHARGLPAMNRNQLPPPSAPATAEHFTVPKRPYGLFCARTHTHTRSLCPASHADPMSLAVARMCRRGTGGAVRVRVPGGPAPGPALPGAPLPPSKVRFRIDRDVADRPG